MTVLSLALAAVLNGDPLDPAVSLPAAASRCLEKGPMQRRVTVASDVNPFYLRGDLTGDGRLDYAIAVKGVRSGKLRVLVCTATGQAFLLGQEDPSDRPFSDMPDDNFFGAVWQLFSPAEVRELTRFKGTARPLPTRRAEAIAMIWEDGISLIQWDGKTFRWISPQR
jgi:hypothetical protein